jgi:hypothetical protein
MMKVATGDLKSAEEEFRKILNNNSKDVVSLYGLAMAQFNKNNLDECVKTCQKIIKINPFCSLNIFHLMGLSLYRLKMHEHAFKIFSLILKADPSHSPTLLTLSLFNSTPSSSLSASSHPLHLFHSILLSSLSVASNPLLTPTISLFKSLLTPLDNPKGFLSTSSLLHPYAILLYLSAKSHHSRREFEKAEEMYMEALRIWPRLPAAIFGITALEGEKREGWARKLVMVVGREEREVREVLEGTAVVGGKVVEKVYEPMKVYAKVVGRKDPGRGVGIWRKVVGIYGG